MLRERESKLHMQHLEIEGLKRLLEASEEKVVILERERDELEAQVDEMGVEAERVLRVEKEKNGFVREVLMSVLKSPLAFGFGFGKGKTHL
jgi:SMC interacting uncharacterized protein involved in chromosome segregation